jgi:hypothetical protein
MDPERVTELTKLIKTAAARISRMLGSPSMHGADTRAA